MHSWTMSSLPASWRLLKFGLVCPWREKRTNSRGNAGFPTVWYGLTGFKAILEWLLLRATSAHICRLKLSRHVGVAFFGVPQVGLFFAF